MAEQRTSFDPAAYPGSPERLASALPGCWEGLFRQAGFCRPRGSRRAGALEDAHGCRLRHGCPRSFQRVQFHDGSAVGSRTRLGVERSGSVDANLRVVRRLRSSGECLVGAATNSSWLSCSPDIFPSDRAGAASPARGAAGQGDLVCERLHFRSAAGLARQVAAQRPRAIRHDGAGTIRRSRTRQGPVHDGRLSRLGPHVRPGQGRSAVNHPFCHARAGTRVCLFGIRRGRSIDELQLRMLAAFLQWRGGDLCDERELPLRDFGRSDRRGARVSTGNWEPGRYWVVEVLSRGSADRG